MKEDHLESACLDWLGELGWTCVHGDGVSPGGDQCDRARYSDVVLASRLREATVRLNPELAAAFFCALRFLVAVSSDRSGRRLVLRVVFSKVSRRS